MDRRSFLHISSASIAVLAIGCKAEEQQKTGTDIPQAQDTAQPDVEEAVGTTLNNWVEIYTDNKVEVYISKAEMGQGISTGLAMVVADELNAKWEDIKVSLVGEMDQHYFSNAGIPVTFGSTSTKTQYAQLRFVAAAARQMLEEAAANQWGVDPSEVSSANSQVLHPDHGSLDYGELVEQAALLPVPELPTLKTAEEFTIIGTERKRIEHEAVLEGKVVYGIDADVPNMLYASVRKSPVFGGEVLNFSALSHPEAEAIVQIPNGIAVVATSWWKANQIVQSLAVEFSTPAELMGVTDESIMENLLNSLDESGEIAHSEGDAESGLAQAATTYDAIYKVPYLAHAPLEPVTATAWVQADRCEVWAPTQAAMSIRTAAQEITGLDTEKITVHATYLGGGFGRKGESDYAEQAILISQQVGTPVKLIWNRPEDLQQDFYRPIFCAHLVGGFDADGKLTTWYGKSVGSSVLLQQGASFAIDPTSVEGFDALPYEFDNEYAEHVSIESPIPLGFWRSVGHSQNTFFVECFMDELAELMNKDPLDFRRELLPNTSRALAILERLETMSNWGNPPAGRHHGISFSKAYSSFIAQVAEISFDEANKQVTIHKFYCVADCGLVINPNGLRAQIEGGISFGLSAAMNEKITIQDGAVQQSNFHDYKVLTLPSAPEIEVELIQGSSSPGGVGELAVGPSIPALVNAIYAASGIRIRSLPISEALA